MKKVLFITYAFPPWGVIGALRPFKFAKYLPDFGWQPVVLTRKIRDHIEEIDKSLLNQLEVSVRIYSVSEIGPRQWYERFSARSKCVKIKPKKTHNNLSNKENFITLMKSFWRTWIDIPDSHIGWLPFAILKGLEIITREKIDVIYSTSDPFTCHLVALLLKKITKKPWVADFRDPWTQYPLYECHSPIRRRVDESLEQAFLQTADIVTVTSNATANGFVHKYPSIPSKKIITITNGFDPCDMENINLHKNNQKFTITFTGNFFSVSSSNQFLEAVREFLESHPLARSKILIRFVGLLDEVSQHLIGSLNLHDVVQYLGYVSYQKSLQYQADSDVLLLTRSSEPGNEVIIPAKLFEYLAIRKPILALIPTEGEASKLIRETRSGIFISPDDRNRISETIFEMYSKYESNNLQINRHTSLMQRYERKYLTSELSKLFNALV